MGRYGYRVIDADGHVFEPPSLYDDFLTRYLDERYRPTLREIMQESKEKGTSLVYTRNRLPPRPWTGRQLGVVNQTEEPSRPGGGMKLGAKGAEVATMWDPKLRLEDMDLEGIDIAVVYPSGMSSFCTWEDTGLEAAMYQAYNRAVADFCSFAPDRLKWVALVSMRDMEAATSEIRRVAKDSTMVGTYISGHSEDKLLDDPFFHPIFEETLSFDLPIAVHGGSVRPPYGIGTFEFGENWFIQHASTNPYEQMRAMAALIGGGVFDKFPNLRFAFLESGCGWVPYWLYRLDEHYELMPRYVPLLTRKPSEVMKSRDQCFVSCEPGEFNLGPTIEWLGEEKVLYASDYPHFDSDFPNTVKGIVEREDLGDSAKKKILEENALRLYPRLR